MGREQNSASRRGVKGCENYLSSAHCRAVVFWNRWAVLSQIGCAERRFHVFERVSGDVAFFPIVPKGSRLCASHEIRFYRFEGSSEPSSGGTSASGVFGRAGESEDFSRSSCKYLNSIVRTKNSRAAAAHAMPANVLT